MVTDIALSTTNPMSQTSTAIQAFRALLGALGADAARAALSARGQSDVSAFVAETQAFVDSWQERGEICAPQPVLWRTEDVVWYQTRHASVLLALERAGRTWRARASILARELDEPGTAYVPAAEWWPPVEVKATYRLHALAAVAAVARALGVTEGVALSPVEEPSTL